MTTLKSLDLRSLNALKEYLEEHEAEINASQWQKVVELVDKAWLIVERRKLR